MKHSIFVMFVAVGILCACGNGGSTETTETGISQDTTANQGYGQAAPAGNQLDLGKAEFRMSNSNFQDDPNMGIPSFDIYLHISGAADSLLIARDYAASFFDKASLDGYDKLIPAGALFLINSYYAGGGYYYYGMNEGNVLKIYRLYQAEGNPDNEGDNRPPPSPQLIKSAKLFADHNEVTQLAQD